MSASLFYRSFRSQETGESNESCLRSLLLLQRQKSKWQGNLKTTQCTRNPPPPLQPSLFAKRSATQPRRQRVTKGPIHHTETQTWVITFTHSQVAALNVFQAQSKGPSDCIWRKDFPPRKKGGALLVAFPRDHSDWSTGRDESSSVPWPWRYCSLKSFAQSLQCPRIMPTTPASPSPGDDASQYLTLSFHTGRSQFLFQPAGTDLLPPDSANTVPKTLLCKITAWISAGGRRCAAPVAACWPSLATWDLKRIPHRVKVDFPFNYQCGINK